MFNKELKKIVNQIGFKKVGGKPDLNAHYRLYNNDYMEFDHNDQPYFGKEIITIIDNYDNKTCDVIVITDLDFMHEDQPEDMDFEINKIEYKDIILTLEGRTQFFRLSELSKKAA